MGEQRKVPTKPRMLTTTSLQNSTTKSLTPKTTSRMLSNNSEDPTVALSNLNPRVTQSAHQLVVINTSTQSQMPPRTGQRTTVFQTSVWTEPPPVTSKISQLPRLSLDINGPPWEPTSTRRNSRTEPRMLTTTSPHNLTVI